MSVRRSFRRWAATIAALAALTACGSSELPVDPTFDGLWSVTELTDGSAVGNGGGLLVEIDTGEAALRGRTGCGEFFGSYTLIDDGGATGPASFTIPSPAPDDACGDADRANHEALVEALESVTQWRQDPQSAEPAMELTSPSGARVVLTRAG